jgi:hypothetical protein
LASCGASFKTIRYRLYSRHTHSCLKISGPPFDAIAGILDVMLGRAVTDL